MLGEYWQWNGGSRSRWKGHGSISHGWCIRSDGCGWWYWQATCVPMWWSRWWDLLHRIRNELSMKTPGIKTKNHACLVVCESGCLGAEEPLWFVASDYILNHEPSTDVAWIELVKPRIEAAGISTWILKLTLRQCMVECEEVECDSSTNGSIEGGRKKTSFPLSPTMTVEVDWDIFGWVAVPVLQCIWGWEPEEPIVWEGREVSIGHGKCGVNVGYESAMPYPSTWLVAVIQYSITQYSMTFSEASIATKEVAFQ